MFHTDLPSLKTKAEMYRYYERGYFGNRALTWPTRKAMLEAGYQGKIGLRYKDPRGGGAFFRTEMSLEEADAEYENWLQQGAKPELIVWCESIPTDRIQIQGELQRGLQHWDFTYSTEKGVPNRPRMWKHPRHASGVVPLILCRYFMWPKSFENLMELFDLYPDAVVEFTVVDYECGSIPGHNTIFWEVRHY